MNGWKGIAISVAFNFAVIALVFRVKMLREIVIGKGRTVAGVSPLKIQNGVGLNPAQELKIATVGTLETKGRTTQPTSELRRAVPMPHFPRM